ncbi:MAG: biotin--[Paludibacteraceae bacterium]|nr:biotin--[acetyl-CoA-carboxylase] ligase [Paludibacteraceae bacterium]
MFVTSTNSTNTLLKQMIADGNPPEFIRAGYQTAGRGQTGNGWESEADKNLLCSILLPPRKELFELNVSTAVAVQRLLGEDFTIKWPNDIYWQDRKIAGILIENAIVGNEVKYCIAGIGLNVNQTEWLSDAPNPVSLKQITGREYPIDELMQQLFNEVNKALQEDVWDYYKAHLYRREGFWPFVERVVSVAPTMNAGTQTQGQFMAQIKDVLPSGELVLEDQQGTKRIYHFKQIRYIV